MITDEVKLKEVFDRFSQMAISTSACLQITDCEDLREFLKEYYSRGYDMPRMGWLTPEEEEKLIDDLVQAF